MNKKCGFVTIIGAPNVGKSTLTNYLIGEKITIVSPKVQTTRATIKGIFLEDNTQLIFADTPGIFEAKKNLEKSIVANALENIAKESQIVFMCDAKKLNQVENDLIFYHIKLLKRKVLIVINKIDLITKEQLDGIIKKYKELEISEEVFAISAQEGTDIMKLKKHLISKAPDSEFLYPESDLTTVPVRFLAQEITREKLFLLLAKELPYNLSVETISWKEDKQSHIVIHQDIYVSKEGQKKIIIGSRGSLIKEVGSLAREEIAKLTGVKTHLFLHVKVRADWLDKPYMYQHMGLKFPKKNN
jgi:GTP-binding protein Era